MECLEGSGCLCGREMQVFRFETTHLSPLWFQPSIAYLLIILALTVFPVAVLGGPLCHTCARIPFPRDCDVIVRCGDSEVCYLEELISQTGAVLFNSGCRVKSRCSSIRHEARVRQQEDDIMICSECCDTDFCNTKGCNSPGFPPLSDRGPICFSCHQHLEPGTCDTVSFCSPGEHCYIIPVKGVLDDIYSSGCMTNAQCTTLHTTMGGLIGKRDQVSGCKRCCHDDYCNMNCSGIYILPPDQTATAPITAPMSHPQNTITPTTKLTPGPTAHSTTSQSVDPITEAKCHTKGYKWEGSLQLCYQVHQSELLTWSTARARCRHEGGDLIILGHDNRILQFLRDRHFYGTSGPYSNTRYWIGASDLLYEKDWRWLDGSIVDPGMFHLTEPSNMYPDRGGENCGTVAYTDVQLKLNDDVCDTHYHFICQIQHTQNVQTHVPCIDQEFQYATEIDKCYMIYSKDTAVRTWQQARDFCKSKNGDLLMLKDKAEEDWFSRRLEQVMISHAQRFSIGATDREVEGQFRWLNHQLLSRDLNWNAGEPNDFKTHEDCVAFSFNQNLALNDIDCNTAYNFICEETCTADGYTLAADGMFIKIYNTTATWPVARQQCFLDNADLVIPDTLQKLQYLQSKLDVPINKGSEQYWIGAYDRLHTSHYTWVTGNSMDVTRDFWHHGEPNGKNESCVALWYYAQDSRMLFNDAPCLNYAFRFVCQKLW